MSSPASAFQISLIPKPAAPKMGIVISGSNIGTINFPTALTFGTTWRVKARLRRSVPGPNDPTSVYITTGEVQNGWLLVFGFVGNAYEVFFANTVNSTGANKRVATGLVNDFVYHTIEFTYANGVFSAFLDGQLSNTVNGAFTVTPQPKMQIGTGTYSGAFDYLFIESDGVKQLEFNFLETSGATFANTGSLGGSITFIRTPGRESVA
jgi:hypothetical protein